MSSGQDSHDETENRVAEREELGNHENWLFRGDLNKTTATLTGRSHAQPPSKTSNRGGFPNANLLRA